MTEQERLEADIEQCTAKGVCPRCGEEVGADSARAHVEGCEGCSQKLPAELREEAPRVRRRDVEVGGVLASVLGECPGWLQETQACSRAAAQGISCWLRSLVHFLPY